MTDLVRVHYIMGHGGLRSVMKGNGGGGIETDTTQQAIYQKEVNATHLHYLHQCLKSTAAFRPQSYNQKQLRVHLQDIIF